MKSYCLVINGQLKSDPMPLPTCYKNISNFYCLPDDKTVDLAWSENPGEGFWPVTEFSIPDYLISQKIQRNVSLNTFNRTVSVTYSVVDISEQEYNSRIKSIESRIRSIRDNYLKLTDFTQLADAPITDISKAEFATFRQQLRDILNNVTDPTSVTWPAIPISAPNIVLSPFPPIPSYKDGVILPM